MPRYLLTCPGRHGDILWSLPCARALHEGLGADVEILVSPAYGAVLPLIQRQAYVQRTWSHPFWAVQETAPMTPWRAPLDGVPVEDYAAIVHLGYRDWPQRPLPYEHLRELCLALPPGAVPPVEDAYTLQRPWLAGGLTRWTAPAYDVAVAFTDEWIELKAGVVLRALAASSLSWCLLVPHGGRWWTEYRGAFGTTMIATAGYADLAERLADAAVVLADNSAPHVVACGVGRPVVLLEPATARHHPIFYPYGPNGPEVTLVRGGDGQPTFDARHVADALQRAVEKARG